MGKKAYSGDVPEEGEDMDGDNDDAPIERTSMVA
jgi:hypothetical protein